MIGAPHGVLKHVVMNPERRLKRPGVFYQEATGLIGLKQLLVRVQSMVQISEPPLQRLADRVGQLLHERWDSSAFLECESSPNQSEQSA